MNNLSTYLLKIALGCFLILTACGNDDDGATNPTAVDCTTTNSVFAINLSSTSCTVDIQAVLNTPSVYTESVNGTTRTMVVNNIANHNVGTFPNSGNPNEIESVTETYTVTTTPSQANSVTYGQGYTTGVLFSGVVIEPYTAEFFTGSGGTNMNWNITALQSTTDLGLDCNNAHVQPTGRYHYHGKPSASSDIENADGTQMIKVGYAADGFPIYYKYGYASDNTTIVAYSSGWALKTTDRGGDGVSAPSGCPDGYYFQDYEYVGGDLDECNGITGKTPDSESEYYYLITDNFPSVPLCFTGTPNSGFRH